MAIDVKVIQEDGNKYALQVTKDNQTAKVPLKGVKSIEEAYTIRDTLSAEINKNAVAEGTPPPGVGDNLKTVA